MIKLLACLLAFNSVACSDKKDNKPEPKKDFPELVERDELYCSLGQPHLATFTCDAALFESVHALACGAPDPKRFEYNQTGKLCRAEGCSCYDNSGKPKGERPTDSGFSKDMATGMQVYYSAKPDKELAQRVQTYGVDNKWTVCDADDAVTLLSKCVMSPKIVYRWAEIERKGARIELEGLDDQPEDQEARLVGNTDFRAHLDVLGVVTEQNLYGGISDKSLATIKAQAEREPNNLLFQAMLAVFVKGDEKEVAKNLLTKFPIDRLPTTGDWCTDYLYQRDEYRGDSINKDWLPCENENKTHPGTDYLLASWVLQHLR